MAKYLLLKHYRGAPTPDNDIPMDQWTPDEVEAHIAFMRDFATRLEGTGETFKLKADMIFKAIGQTFVPDPMKDAIVLDGGRIRVDASRRTSLPDVWAGGDCAQGGQDLTVAAVDDGRRAAEAIHAYLSR